MSNITELHVEFFEKKVCGTNKTTICVLATEEPKNDYSESVFDIWEFDNIEEMKSLYPSFADLLCAFSHSIFWQNGESGSCLVAKDVAGNDSFYSSDEILEAKYIYR